MDFDTNENRAVATWTLTVQKNEVEKYYKEYNEPSELLDDMPNVASEAGLTDVYVFEKPQDGCIAMIKIHLGFTKNAGKYENFKADVELQIPVKPDDLDVGFKALKDKCVEKLSELKKMGVGQFLLDRL